MWSCLAACSNEHAASLCTFLLSKSWCLFIENMLYTLHATYIKHDLYADFSLRFKKLLKKFSYDKFTVQDEQNLSLLQF